MIYESVFAVSPILTVIALVTSVLTLASFVKVYQTAFLGPERPELVEVHEVPRGMIVGMSVLAVVILIMTLFPSWTVRVLIHPAAVALVDKASYVHAVMGGAL